MARFTLNLNAPATRTMAGASKVRIKVENGILKVKPTDRVCGKALPKGEKLVALSRRNSSTVKFGLRGVEAKGLNEGWLLTVKAEKHGWFRIAAEDGCELGNVRVCKG